jgi:hypothetical protein
VDYFRKSDLMMRGTDKFFEFEGQPKTDFLDVEFLRKDEFIVTNPPFSLMKDFFEKCFSLGNYFAILCRLEVISTVYFKNFYDTHKVDVLLMTKKIIFSNEERDDIDLGKCCWVIYCGKDESHLLVV